jgi:hypothetical protein
VIKFNENINHVESKGEEYCVQFNSLQFKDLNSIELHSIQIALCKFIQYQIIQMELNFYIMTLVDKCSVFLGHLTRCNFLANLEQEVYHKK